MTKKAKFNKIYGQDPKQTNSLQTIATLTNIPESVIKRRYNEYSTLCYTHGYDSLYYKSKERFAYSKLYEFAINNRRK